MVFEGEDRRAIGTLGEVALTAGPLIENPGMGFQNPEAVCRAVIVFLKVLIRAFIILVVRVPRLALLGRCSSSMRLGLEQFSETENFNLYLSQQPR